MRVRRNRNRKSARPYTMRRGCGSLLLVLMLVFLLAPLPLQLRVLVLFLWLLLLPMLLLVLLLVRTRGRRNQTDASLPEQRQQSRTAHSPAGAQGRPSSIVHADTLCPPFRPGSITGCGTASSAATLVPT